MRMIGQTGIVWSIAASRPLRMKGHFIVARHAASCASQHSDRSARTGWAGLSVASGILGQMDKNTTEKHYLRMIGKAAIANELDWFRQRGGEGPSQSFDRRRCRLISLKMLQLPHGVEKGRTPTPRGEARLHSTVSALRRNRQPLTRGKLKNCNSRFLAPGRPLICQGLPKDIFAVPAQIFWMRGMVDINGFDEPAAGVQQSVHHLARHLVS